MNTKKILKRLMIEKEQKIPLKATKFNKMRVSKAIEGFVQLMMGNPEFISDLKALSKKDMIFTEDMDEIEKDMIATELEDNIMKAVRKSL